MFGEFIYAKSLFAASGAVKQWQELCKKATEWVEVSKTSSSYVAQSKNTSGWVGVNKSEILVKKCSQ